jgi:hypothetical protein
VGAPCTREANGIASSVQDLLASHASHAATPLVPDRDPKLHCIRLFFHSPATTLVTAWHGLTKALAVRMSFRPAVEKPILRGRNQDDDPHELSRAPASQIRLADGGCHSSLLSCWRPCALHTISVSKSSANPSYVYLRQPMKRADLAASTSRFGRSCGVYTCLACFHRVHRQKRLSHTRYWCACSGSPIFTTFHRVF